MWDPLYPQVGHIAVNPDDGRLIGLDYYGIWASADGTTWELVHKYDGDSIPSHPDRTAIWYREHIIASDPDTGIWSSSDGGVTWTRHDWTGSGLDGGVSVFTDHNGRLIATGDSIWIGTPTDQ